jgi:hypothetical protein
MDCCCVPVWLLQVAGICSATIQFEAGQIRRIEIIFPGDSNQGEQGIASGPTNDPGVDVYVADNAFAADPGLSVLMTMLRFQGIGAGDLKLFFRRPLTTLAAPTILTLKFESYHPSQPVRSRRWRFRACENLQYFSWLGHNRPVSSYGFSGFLVRTGVLRGPASARHFPISFFTYRRPVR